MPHRILKPENTTGRIIWTLIGTTLVAIATVIGLAFWMASVTNQTAAEKSRKIVSNALVAARAEAATMVSDFTLWGDMHSWLDTAQNHATGHHRPQSPAGQLMHQFALLYILAPDGTAIHGVTDGETFGQDAGLSDAARGAILQIAPKNDLSGGKVNAGFIRLDDTPYLVTVGWMAQNTADHGATNQGAHLMVAGQPIDPTFLTDLAQQYVIDGLSLAPQNEPGPSQMSRMALLGADGTTVTTIRWFPPRPGDVSLQQVAPIIAALSCLLLAGNLLAGRSTAHQTANFLREHAMARTDQLTRLMNRAGLDDLAATPPVKRRLATGAAAVIYMDLNGFKSINDTLGHEAGDRALQLTAQRLIGAVREVDIVARIGGDEFVCLLLDDAPDLTAKEVVARIFAATDHPLNIQNTSCVVQPSIGVATAQAGISWEKLLHQADVAMYHAKNTGARQAKIYDDSLDTVQVAAAKAMRAS